MICIIIKGRENTKKYHFQGKSARSIRWFFLDHEWLEETFRTRKPYFYGKLYKINIEGQQMETYQIFLFPVGNTRITEELDVHPRAPVLKY